jgi:peptidoglycan/LPS O-acetylase OafA/YrhL
LTPAVATAAPVIARKPPLTALTGLRTLLALSIVFFHFTPPHMELLSPIFNNGFVFVGFFFLISGFILAYNYAERPTPLVKRDFWVARFSRLYPVYLVALALSFQMLQSGAPAPMPSSGRACSLPRCCCRAGRPTWPPSGIPSPGRSPASACCTSPSPG